MDKKTKSLLAYHALISTRRKQLAFCAQQEACQHDWIACGSDFRHCTRCKLFADL